MPLSPNEIKNRALKFAREWKDATGERSEAQTFWNESPGQGQTQRVEEAAENVLEVRKQFDDSSLADLYDAVAMPPALRKAHTELDKAVDGAYGRKRFKKEADRVAYLFERYARLTKEG